MASLNLNVPDELKFRLQQRASENGYDSVEKYIEAVLEATAEDATVDEDLEALLLERIKDPRPTIPYDKQFQEQFRREIERRRQGRRS
ncbi:MAG TPA: hypothetical protein VF669_22500 [Tepidisphaeraceae bacterium]|jgi:hypothetical protein